MALDVRCWTFDEQVFNLTGHSPVPAADTCSQNSVIALRPSTAMARFFFIEHPTSNVKHPPKGQQ